MTEVRPIKRLRCSQDGNESDWQTQSGVMREREKSPRTAACWTMGSLLREARLGSGASFRTILRYSSSPVRLPRTCLRGSLFGPLLCLFRAVQGCTMRSRPVPISVGIGTFSWLKTYILHAQYAGTGTREEPGENHGRRSTTLPDWASQAENLA